MSVSQVTGKNLPFIGLSETSYNLAIFYEQGSLSSRLAYNYRDDRLLTSTGSGVFPTVTPVFIEEYASLDGSVSYSFDVQGVPVSVFLSATNLTDEYELYVSLGTKSVMVGLEITLEAAILATNSSLISNFRLRAGNTSE